MTQEPLEYMEWRTRTWYGLPVRVVVSSSNVHRVWGDGIQVPHVGLVNLISRQGLPRNVRLELTARHELGHLQTLPVPLVHALLLWRGYRGKHIPKRWFWPLALVAHQAIWEVAAESYVVATDPRAVRHPRPAWARRLYGFFWFIMALLAVGLTWLLASGESKPNAKPPEDEP